VVPYIFVIATSWQDLPSSWKLSVKQTKLAALILFSLAEKGQIIRPAAKCPEL
jgi:hypothetical protein